MVRSRPSWMLGFMLIVFSLAQASSAQQQSQDPSGNRDERLMAGDRIVESIEVRGNRYIANERILSTMQTKPGRPLIQEQLHEDVQRLVRQNWFYNVLPQVLPVDDQRVRVVINVGENGVIRKVEFQGNNAFAKAKLIRLVDGLKDIAQGSANSPANNMMACRSIERFYQSRGFPYATCELLEGSRIDDANVIFKITEGPAVAVKTVQFTGNQFVTGPRLRTLISTRGSLANRLPIRGFFGEYQVEKIDDDTEALRSYYRQNGFLDAKVGRKIEWDNEHRFATVTFEIEEGMQYKVGDVRFEGGSIPAVLNNVPDQLLLVQGTTVDGLKLEADRAVIRDTLGKHGILNSVVQADYKWGDKPGVADIVYKIQDDTPKRINDIIIVGNDVTKGDVIRSRLLINPGEVIDTTKLRASEESLQRTRWFQPDPNTGRGPSVMVDPEGDPIAEYQNIIVDVRESMTGSILLGGGVNSDSGVAGQLTVTERNFDIWNFPRSWSDVRSGYAWRGAGQEFNLVAMPGNQVSQYSVSVREPMLFGRPISLATNLYYFQRFFQNYHERRTGAQVTLGRRFTERGRLGLSGTLRAEDIKLSLPSGQDPAFTPNDILNARGHTGLYSVRVAADYEGRDSMFDPSRGHFVELSYEQVFGDYTYPVFGVEGRKYFTLFSRGDNSGKHILALRSQAKFAGDDVPVFERFYAGGFSSLRGFQWRGVSPTDLGVEIGGKFMFLASAEYRIPLSPDDNFGMVFFCDTGTVERKIEINDYRVALGFGFRVKMRQQFGEVPLAFDFGFPVIKGQFDDRQLFSFFLQVNQ